MDRPPRVIDIHAHAVLEAGFGVAGRYGPELAVDSDGVSFFRIGEYRMKPMAYRGTVFMDFGKRLELMDRVGIDLQLLSPNPLTFFHGIESDLALKFCRVHNDAMAEVVAEGIARFRNWAPESVRENGFRHEVRKLWFDAHVEGQGALDLLIEAVGRDRLVYGSNFGGWDTPQSTSAFDASLTPNAEKLLRLASSQTGSAQREGIGD